MSHMVRFSNLTIGGTGADNPVPLTQANYDLSSAEQKLTYQNINVIVEDLNVTGIAEVNQTTGQPMIGPTDICRLPCPPYCR